MRILSADQLLAWRSGDYTGSRRPMQRATLQIFQMGLQSHGVDTYAQYMFAQPIQPIELPNVRKINWDRHVDTDAATCKLELYNTKPLPLGTAVTPDDAGNYIYDQPGYYCADDQTEVLSQRGWLRYDDVKIGDWIYTISPLDGRAEWDQVREVFAKPYDGDLVSMESKSMSALVTDNHRWLVRDRKGRPLSFRETRELRSSDSIPLIAEREDTVQLLSDDLVELAGWVATDGSFQRPGNGQRVTIYQSRTANADKCDLIRLLLKRLNAKYAETWRDDGMTAFRFSGAVAVAVRALLPEKKLTAEFVNMLTVDQCKMLLRTLALGDGGTQGGGTSYVCTKDEEQAGVIQMIAALAGFTTRCHRRELATAYGDVVMFYVNIKKAKHVHVGDITTEPVAYQGIVWCPRTLNGTFLARRGGRVYFTGNTFNRGKTTFTNRWHHVVNEWQDMLVPDRIIRTYEGRGFDPTVGPDYDPHMTQSGVWIIDDVDYEATTGLITLTCRDAGRLLIEQILFPPVVPKARYPVHFVANQEVANVAHEDPSTVWTTPTYDTDSSGAHSGPDENIVGHYAHDAYDGDATTYWMSVGYNTADQGAAFEWIQGSFASQSINAVDVTTRGGPYVVYVSVYTTDNGTSTPGAPHWGGGANIPYDPTTSSSPNAANIPYVHSYTVPANTRTALRLGDTLTGCTKVRLTFHHLYNTHVGTPMWSTETFRAEVYGTRISANYTLTPGTGTHTEGDYGDYSEIIKRFLAYGGFHWPSDDTAFVTATDGARVALPAPTTDTFLGSGRIWGDIMDTGTTAIPGTNLDPTVWDKKSLMDGIAYVRDIVGFNFFIDESGAAIFRSPNIWKIGNYVAYDGIGTVTYSPVAPLSQFFETFGRPDSALVGNGWTQTGGDFVIDAGRAITRDASSSLGRPFGHKYMYVEADLRTPDDMQPTVFLWSAGGEETGYRLSFAPAALGINLELRRNNVIVDSTHIGPVGVALGNVTKGLKINVVLIGTVVVVGGYLDGALTLSFSEDLSTAPTGTYAGVANAGLAGTNGVVVDNVNMVEPAPTTLEGMTPDGSYLAGADNLVVIDENETLVDLSVTLSSRNTRERVFIANTNGQIGATARGHTGPSGPFDARLRRNGGWTDQHFASVAECNVMADLIALRQLFTYRTDRLTIPGCSAIQTDDQIRIIEGTTSEDYVHYVNGITSEWDIESGEWTYALDTHWLGETPFENWAFDPAKFTTDTIAFLEANGSL